MGDVAAAFDAPPTKRRQGPRSEIDKILSRLDDQDAAKLREVLMDGAQWTDREVAERLSSAGIDCSYWNVRNWRIVNGAIR